MLKSIRVTNFKIVRDLSALPLMPLTVFIGRNASGKSSIIGLLDWLSRAVSEGAASATRPFQRVQDIISYWSPDHLNTFGINLIYDPEDVSVGSEIRYEVEVASDPAGHKPLIVAEALMTTSGDEELRAIRTKDGSRFRRVPIGATGSPTTTRYRELKNGDLVPRRPQKRELELVWTAVTDGDHLVLSDVDPAADTAGAHLKTFLERAVFLRLSPRAISNFSTSEIEPSTRLLDDQGEGLARLLTELDPETLEILIEKLSFIIQSAAGLDAHTPVGPADRRYFSFREGGRDGGLPLEIPAWVLSEGTRRVTAILAVLLHDNPPPLLCIEEIENGLDPWTLHYMLNELAGAVERGTQVILTSHSPYLLNLLPLDSIILSERRDEGARFLSGATLPDLGAIQQRMGPGDLYINHYLTDTEE